MKIAATGVTSSVGRRFCEVARERGHEVVGLVRDPQRMDAKSLERIGVRLVVGDVNNAPALDTLVGGADVVMHAAAAVGDNATREEMQRVNVEGTQAIVESAAKAGVGHFVNVSSTAVYGRPDHGRVTEAWPSRIVGTPYEDTKTQAERLAFERGKELGLSVIAIRPPIIYGPYDHNFMPRALQSLKRRIVPLIDGGKAPLNVVWVDHVIDVLLAAAGRRDLGGEAFNVMDCIDKRPPSVREVFETIARAADLPLPRIHLSYAAAMTLAKSIEFGYSRFKPQTKPPITPFVVKILTRDVIYDASKAAAELGFVPRMNPLAGIAHFAALFAGKISPHEHPKP
ncbi:MAG TPA: NAD-dependent epimerase/dehydratase family protein [Polyangium sp.]|nr:NAD-dependent epimerase/dehydratase family protein [Polyangium sp.]